MVYAGDIVRAGDVSSDWADFTPSFTNFTVGANGALAGRWRRISNKLIVFRAQLTLGAASSVGGTLGLTIPGSLSGEAANLTQTVPTFAWDSSASTGYIGAAKLASGGGTALDRFYGPSSTLWNATAPFTWATGDFLEVQGWLEVTT